MAFFRRQSIAYRLFGLFGGTIVLIVILGLFSVYTNTYTQTLLAKTRKEAESLNAIKEFRYHFSYARKEEKNWLIFRSEHYLRSREKSLARAQNLLFDLKNKLPQPELEEMLETLESHLLHYSTLAGDLAGVKTPKQIEVFTQKARAIDENVIEQVTEMTNVILQRMDQNQKLAEQTLQNFSYWSLAVFLLGLIVLFGVGCWGLFHLKQRLNQLVQASQRMALADYAPQLETSRQDELGVLAAHFNEMAAKIADREAKITQITQELIHANNLLKKGGSPLSTISKIRP